MATIILMFILVLLSFVVTPWIGYLNHNERRHIDMMAGDEGE